MTALEDGTYTAVVDAVEDGFARVFFEQDGEDVASETLPAGDLPEEGRHADAIFTVNVRHGELADWSYEPETTQERQQSAQDRFDQLSSRHPNDDDEDA